MSLNRPGWQDVRAYNSRHNGEVHRCERNFFTNIPSLEFEARKYHMPLLKKKKKSRKKAYHSARLKRRPAWNTRAGTTASTISTQVLMFRRFEDHAGQTIGVGRVLDADPVQFVSLTADPLIADQDMTVISPRSRQARSPPVLVHRAYPGPPQSANPYGRRGPISDPEFFHRSQEFARSAPATARGRPKTTGRRKGKKKRISKQQARLRAAERMWNDRFIVNRPTPEEGGALSLMGSYFPELKGLYNQEANPSLYSKQSRFDMDA